MKLSLFLLGGLICAFHGAANAQTPSDSVIPNAPKTVSLGVLLQLQSGQIERLNRLHSDFDARRARHLERGTTQKIAADLVSTRTKALQILSPVQRVQLQALAGDSRFRLRADEYHQLFLQPAEDAFSLANSLTNQENREFDSSSRPERFNSLKGTGSYGVYGGYSYGRPDIGVYGGYNQGSVGVNVGIGRGGPSVGVNIGRVFGFIR